MIQVNGNCSQIPNPNQPLLKGLKEYSDHLIDYKQHMLSFTTDHHKSNKSTHFWHAVLCIATNIHVCVMWDVHAFSAGWEWRPLVQDGHHDK